MNRIFSFACISLALGTGAFAAQYDSRFRNEVKSGLPHGRIETAVITPNYAIDTTIAEGYGDYGELGREVFYDSKAETDDEFFVPTTMYLRMGGGLSVPALTRRARVDDMKYRIRDSWNITIGAGWNMSSYVRTEVDFQKSSFRFDDLENLTADYYTANGMLYFDFLRRYIRAGDITYRRSFIPFMGIGMGIGLYDFAGSTGASGFMVAAPRAELGMTFMLNDLIGLDIAYQYQMIIGHGFGWETQRNGVDNIGNVMATFRMNF